MELFPKFAIAAGNKPHSREVSFFQIRKIVKCPTCPATDEMRKRLLVSESFAELVI